MLTKFLIFVLGIFLLVECSHGSVIGKRRGTFDLTPFKNDLPAMELIDSVKNELVIREDSTYNIARAVFQPLVANFNATGKTDKAIIDNIFESLKEIFEKSNKADQDVDKDAFLNDFFDLVSDFEKVEQPNASELEKKFKKAKETMMGQLQQPFKSITDRVIVAADKFWNSLPAEKQQQHNEFHDKLTTLKNGPDDNKMRVFDLIDVFLARDYLVLSS